MKKYIFLVVLSLMGLASAGQQRFVVRGTVPKSWGDIPVALRSVRGGTTVAQTKTADGKFLLEGELPESGFFRLLFIRDDRPSAIQAGKDRQNDTSEFKLFMEGGEISFTAVYPDSLHRSSGVETECDGIFFTVEGSRGHDIYVLFNHYMTAYRVEVERLENEWKQAERSGTDRRELVAKLEKARSDEFYARLAFVEENYYPVLSSKLLDEINLHPYLFNTDELEALTRAAASIADENDQVAQYNRRLENYSKYTRGTWYTDLPLIDEEGNEFQFSDLLPDDRYILIDFWASWCGGCRAAFPHIRKIYELCGKNALSIISISIDAKESSWKTALGQENMDWPQYFAPRPAVEILKESYGMVSIPLLLLISPQGYILYSTWSSEEMEMQLVKYLGDCFL